MSDNGKSPADLLDRHLFVLGRWQEYAGEARANVLRIIGIGAFYIVELVNYYGLRLGFIEMPQVVDARFHQVVTALAVAWTMVSLGILVCLRQQFFPPSLKFLSTACDLGLLTAILAVADGPRSPLVIGYFLIIVLATLRLSLPLVRCAAGGAMAGYVFLLGLAWQFPDRGLRVPRYHQLIFLLGLALAGVVLGQVIRSLQGLVRDFADRIGPEREDAP